MQRSPKEGRVVILEYIKYKTRMRNSILEKRLANNIETRNSCTFEKINTYGARHVSLSNVEIVVRR